MTNNSFQLPKTIETHFHATNTDDPALLLSIFAEDAVVFDAGKEYHGKQAIKEWSDIDYFSVHLRLEVINAVQDAKEVVVTAKCDGDYNKAGLPDPLYLDFHFTIEEDKVTRLATFFPLTAGQFHCRIRLQPFIMPRMSTMPNCLPPASRRMPCWLTREKSMMVPKPSAVIFLRQTGAQMLLLKSPIVQKKTVKRLSPPPFPVTSTEVRSHWISTSILMMGKLKA